MGKTQQETSSPPTEDANNTSARGRKNDTQRRRDEFTTIKNMDRETRKVRRSRQRDERRRQEDNEEEEGLKISNREMMSHAAAQQAFRAARQAVRITNRTTSIKQESIRFGGGGLWTALAQKGLPETWGRIAGADEGPGEIISEYLRWTQDEHELHKDGLANMYTGWPKLRSFEGKRARMERKLYQQYVVDCERENKDPQHRMPSERLDKERPRVIVHKGTIPGRTDLGNGKEEGQYEKVYVTEDGEMGIYEEHLPSRPPHGSRQSWMDYTRCRWHNITRAASMGCEIGQLRIVAHDAGATLLSHEGWPIIKTCACGWSIAGANIGRGMIRHRHHCKCMGFMMGEKRRYGVSACRWNPKVNYMMTRPTSLGETPPWWHTILQKMHGTQEFISPLVSRRRPVTKTPAKGKRQYPQGTQQDGSKAQRMSREGLEHAYRVIVAASVIKAGPRVKATVWMAPADYPTNTGGNATNKDTRWNQREMTISATRDAMSALDVDKEYLWYKDATNTERKAPDGARMGCNQAAFMLGRAMYTRIAPGNQSRFDVLVGDERSLQQVSLSYKGVRLAHQRIFDRELESPGRLGAVEGRVILIDNAWKGRINLGHKGKRRGTPESYWEGGDGEGYTGYNDIFFVGISPVEHVPKIVMTSHEPYGGCQRECVRCEETPVRLLEEIKTMTTRHPTKGGSRGKGRTVEYNIESNMGQVWTDVATREMDNHHGSVGRIDRGCMPMEELHVCRDRYGRQERIAMGTRWSGSSIKESHVGRNATIPTNLIDWPTRKNKEGGDATEQEQETRDWAWRTEADGSMDQFDNWCQEHQTTARNFWEIETARINTRRDTLNIHSDKEVGMDEIGKAADIWTVVTPEEEERERIEAIDRRDRQEHFENQAYLTIQERGTEYYESQAYVIQERDREYRERQAYVTGWERGGARETRVEGRSHRPPEEDEQDMTNPGAVEEREERRTQRLRQDWNDETGGFGNPSNMLG